MAKANNAAPEKVATKVEDRQIEILRNPTGFTNLANQVGDKILAHRLDEALVAKLIDKGYAKIVD